MTKICRKCKIEKPFNMFARKKCNKDEKCNYCKECNNALGKIYRNKIKKLVYDKYGGYICRCCGEIEVCFLSVDHINNDGYKFRLGNKSQSSDKLYRWIIKNNYPEEFQILCHNCNLGRHINDGICPHQIAREVALAGRNIGT